MNVPAQMEPIIIMTGTAYLSKISGKSLFDRNLPGVHN